MDRLHSESMDIFARLTDEDLQRKCQTPDHAPITTWKWLRLMVEHEIHHRGQMYLYLAMLGVKTRTLRPDVRRSSRTQRREVSSGRHGH
jgi:uncharacterized damage-inducible protein DinB